MSNDNWKRKFSVRPDRRKQVYSKKLSKWLSPEEEQAFLAMAKLKRDQAIKLAEEQGVDISVVEAEFKKDLEAKLMEGESVTATQILDGDDEIAKYVLPKDEYEKRKATGDFREPVETSAASQDSADIKDGDDEPHDSSAE